MNEWMDFFKVLASLPADQAMQPMRFRDVQPLADQAQAQAGQIAQLQLELSGQQFTGHVLFGILLATILVLGTLIIIAWFRADRHARQIKRILAARVQMKDTHGQLIMDVPLELLINGYKFTVPQPVLDELAERQG